MKTVTAIMKIKMFESVKRKSRIRVVPPQIFQNMMPGRHFKKRRNFNCTNKEAENSRLKYVCSYFQ